MALSIFNSEVDRLAWELFDITGENLTEAIAQALKELLERNRKTKMESDTRRN